MNKLIAVLVFALSALASAAETQVTPDALKTLQPFEHFSRGAGEGVAYEYRPRTKAQFMALLRDKRLAKEEMRVSCDILVRQMMEVHKMLPFEGCEGAAAAMEKDSDFAAVACEDGIFQKDNWLAVTNEQGSAWGVWHRKCLPNEQVLVYRNQPLVSLTCLNVAIPVQLPSAPAPSTPAVLSGTVFKPITGGCPNVYHLKVYVWKHSALTLPGVAQTHAKEELQESFSEGGRQHVSRSHYSQFQKALAAGKLEHSTAPHVFQVSLIMTPEATGGAPTITTEEILGQITVKDFFYEIPFTLGQLQKWDAIRLVPAEDDIVSPPRYHVTGLHEMRFFNHLPGTKLGEWDSNPDPDCVMGEAWIEK